jgi:alkylated DNA repair dioxygenase AlkB
MTAWFGDADYTYSGIHHRAAPFPAVVQRLRERAEAISVASYNAVLLNLYRNGRDSVGWHSDHESGLGDCPTIASLSLGATRQRRTRLALNIVKGHVEGAIVRFLQRKDPQEIAAL